MFSQPPTFQGHEVKGEKSYLQPPYRSQADRRNSVGGASRKTKLLSVNHRLDGAPHFSTAIPALAPRPPTARPRHNVIAWLPGARTHRPRRGSRKPGGQPRAASRNRGSLRARAPGEKRQETAGMREAAGRRRRAAGLTRGTRSGSPGWSGGGVVGCPGCRGEGGEKGDAEGARLLRRADLLLGWRGPGWTDPSVRLCWAPHRVRDLSEDEINPPCKVRCNFPKPGTRLEYTPRAWGQFSPGMTTYLCAGHRAMADLLFQSPAATNNPVRRVYYVVPSFPFGNLGQIILSTGRAAEISWSCSFHQVCLIPKLTAAYQTLEVLNG